MQSGDQLYGYSTIMLAAAPMATQLAIAHIKWTIFFPLFAIPAFTLLMSVGHLSRTAPVLTFRRMAPIGAGIGWALTWHVMEKLYSESLRASQMILYMFFSIRPTLSWAVTCEHEYNTEYCTNFIDGNVSLTDSHHFPDNFWPAQEFNRYMIRANPKLTKVPPVWEPNMWYLGPSDEEFYFALPTLPLVAGHVFTWTVIYFIIVKCYDRLGQILTKFFIVLPVGLYITVMMGMIASGLQFTGKSIQEFVDDKKVNEDPYDFWADVKGGFRTSLLIVDYSTAFTGVIIFATSRLRSGVGNLNAPIAVGIMMIVPAIQTILRTGCESHVVERQPIYRIYSSTDETISFDLFPVCFATSTFGSLWATLYYLAQYLFTSLGPMLIFTSFIYQSFIDDFPTVQNITQHFLALLCAAFTIPSIFLYMPLGTKVAALFRYTSQSALVQILAFIIIFFVYGWQRVEQDVLMTSPTPASPSLVEYLLRPTSPVFSTALFTIVPMMLCTKFVAVFDFLASGNDVVTHIDAGVQFIPLPLWFARFIGYGIMFAPLLIVLSGAAYSLFDLTYRHKLPSSDAFRPSADWMSHASVNASKPRPHSLAYGLFNSILRIQYPTALFILFLLETFIGVMLTALFFLNSLSIIGLSTSQAGNDYRSCIMLLFLILHLVSLFEMRRSQQNNVEPSKLSLYIGVATMETAMLNGYLWMFASDHQWGLDIPPMAMIATNTWIRGCCILTAIAVRAHMLEQQRPSRARDASEIYEADMQNVNDADDDSPVIFDLARA